MSEQRRPTTIFCNGCFDLLHEGHVRFLRNAIYLGRIGVSKKKIGTGKLSPNRLIVAINSDRYARELKLSKWGEKYPRDAQEVRAEKLRQYADEVLIFDTEHQLRRMITAKLPCIIVKGPDYANRRVTGDDLAPVLILDTPEPESVKALKLRVYGQAPGIACTSDNTEAPDHI